MPVKFESKTSKQLEEISLLFHPVTPIVWYFVYDFYLKKTAKIDIKEYFCLYNIFIVIFPQEKNIELGS